MNVIEGGISTDRGHGIRKDSTGRIKEGTVLNHRERLIILFELIAQGRTDPEIPEAYRGVLAIQARINPEREGEGRGACLKLLDL